MSRSARLPRLASIAARAGLALTVLGTLALVLSAVGSRWDWWDFRTGFLLFRSALYGGLAAIVLTLAGLVLALLARAGRTALLSLMTLALLAAVAVVPVTHLRGAGRVPPIHDITTDLEDPPRFVAVLPRRQGAPNPAEHGGPGLAAQQRAGYPDLAPARLPAPADRVFARAVEVARGLGWEIVAAVPAEGRLEATDRTRWFGFRDDNVVRVRPDGAGTRVDVRSVSRVGRSDLGANARRIRTFLEALRADPPTAPRSRPGPPPARRSPAAA
ncbi:MAG TPA: DUF1499 domain-containing protein [Methylomirabilota bacterium]|nr:DUF1499 domain-containing protein [Methylomirabilota bacterium]